MGLSVIGAGFGRTGTYSIKAALEQLGFGPCYHMDNVFSREDHLERWQAVANGEPPDWDALFEGHLSTVDWPGMLYYRELADAYPDAKVLLSTRPPASWWVSFSRTIRRLIGARELARDEGKRRVLSYAHQIIAQQTFGGAIDDREAVLAIYENHVDEVKKAIAPERLLVFEASEGWPPLCRFLGVPEPGEAFPHLNKETEFWQHFGAGVA